MPRQDYKRNERLYQIALRRDWTYAARLAAIGLLAGVVALPALLAGDPQLAPLGRTVSFLGWVFSAGFGGIAVYRYFFQRHEQRRPDSE